MTPLALTSRCRPVCLLTSLPSRFEGFAVGLLILSVDIMLGLLVEDGVYARLTFDSASPSTSAISFCLMPITPSYSAVNMHTSTRSCSPVRFDLCSKKKCFPSYVISSFGQMIWSPLTTEIYADSDSWKVLKTFFWDGQG